jgi:dynein heavy chain
MIISAMGPPGGGKTFITPRFLRHFNIIAFANFDENTMGSIFKTILKWYFRTFNFNSEVQGMDSKIVAATMKIYTKIQDDLKPTPMKSHYTFNLRDFSKVICGMCMAGKNQIPNPDVCIRLWAHETIRVFGDRLINDEDRMWMLTNIKETCRAPFGASFDQTFAHLDIDKNGKVETLDEIRGLIFGDVLTPFGMADRPYEEIQDKEKLQNMCEDAL